MPETYDKTKYAKFYRPQAGGRVGYNPQITIYYDNTTDNNVVCVEERFEGTMWQQTISGTEHSVEWPLYGYYDTFDSWQRSTY